MENELLILEGKLEQLVGLVSRLRADNTSLSAQLQTVQTENRQIHEKMETAKGHVAQLISSIPEEENDGNEGSDLDGAAE
ncbi:MAG: hypothetical protein RIR18_9 [Pseudomonadota bacterium]|jgi:uncharacterized protein (TIGR02449 family)